MEVAVYPSPYTGTPYLCILYPCLDTIEEAAQKALTDNGISYAVMDLEDIPSAPIIAAAMTVDVSGLAPVFDFDMDLALTLALSYNSNYWNTQLFDGLSAMQMTQFQLSAALSTPEGNRSPEQIAALALLDEINESLTQTQSSLNSQTTAEGLMSVLAQLG